MAVPSVHILKSSTIFPFFSMVCHIPKHLSRKGLLRTPVMTRLGAAGRSIRVQYLRIQPPMSSCGDQTKHGESYLCHGLTIKQTRFCRLVLLTTPSTCRFPKPYSVSIKKPVSNPLKFPMRYDNHCPSPQPCLLPGSPPRVHQQSSSHVCEAPGLQTWQQKLQFLLCR